MGIDMQNGSFAATPQDVDVAVGVPETKWFAAIVNPRHEKAIAQRLADQGLETYVASQREMHFWRNGRHKLVDRVIISSIVFVKCTEQTRREIVTLPYIKRFLVNRSANSGTLNKPVAVIRNEEIDTLKFMLGQTDHPVNFEPYTYKIKDTVRVIRGSLKGLIGEITIAPDGTHSLTVVIEQLGCARVNIEPHDVELYHP